MITPEEKSYLDALNTLWGQAPYGSKEKNHLLDAWFAAKERLAKLSLERELQ